MGQVVVTPRRAEIWWGESPDEKGRPYLVVTRDAAIGVLRRLLVAPVTRTVRAIPTEVPLGPDEGLPVQCAASFDNLRPFPVTLLVRRLGSLDAARQHEICAAIAAASGC